MTSKKLSRRLILRGLGGAAIGLPILESITTSKAYAQLTAPAAKRFLCFFEHGGTISATTRTGAKEDGSGEYQGTDGWAPASPAEALQLGPIHAPLAPHLGSLLVLRGIDNKAGWDQSPYNGDHGWANASALTSAVMTKVGTDVFAEGPSIDHVIATRLATRQPVRFASINLEVPAHNYGTPFYTAARQHASRDYNPTTAFNRIFAGVTGGASMPDPAVLRARALKKSVLDGTSAGLSGYKRQLSARDQQVIDEHLTHLRSIETRLDAASVPSVPGCTRPTVPTITGDWYGMNIQVTGPLMADLIVAAFRCGLTNVATLEIGDFYARFLNPTYPAAFDIGHSLHHSANETGRGGTMAARWQDWFDTMLANRRWRIGLLKRVLDGLAATPEGNGTMLDNSLMLWTSEFSMGAIHSVNDMPVLLAGKAGGRLRTGRHLNYNLRAATNPTTLQYQTRSSMHNLFVSILNAFDFPDTQFGSNHVWAHGPLTGLT